MRVGRWMLAVLVATGVVTAPGAYAYANDRAPEVVGGVRAAEGAFPWIVRLSVGCAGALTTKRYVLTAAHCVTGTGRNTSIVVTAGSVDLKSRGAIQVRSRYVRQAPGFRDAELGDDWAVIELERLLDLPTLPLATTTENDRGRFTILGWGATREGGSGRMRFLRTGKVSFVDDRSCGRAYRGGGFSYLAGEMICAGGDGVDTCQGDSGGPMVRPDATGRWVQVGIVSWGNGCARRGYPGVYTQVSKFADTIRRAAAA